MEDGTRHPEGEKTLEPADSLYGLPEKNRRLDHQTYKSVPEIKIWIGYLLIETERWRKMQK